MARSKYRDELPGLVEEYARQGLTDKEIFEKLRISKDTFYGYARQHKAFSDALKRGKEQPNAEVEAAIFKNATGFYAEEITQEIRTVDGRETKYTKKTKKYIPPNATSQIYWTKNRMRGKWSDKIEAEVSGPGGGAIEGNLNIRFIAPDTK